MSSPNNHPGDWAWAAEPGPKRPWLVAALVCFMAVVGILILMAIAGCTNTVTPVHVNASQASLDGNQANSGFIGWAADGSGLITAHARERYNLLVETYGGAFQPPLVRDAGIQATPTNGVFLIDAQHLADFATMNRWRHENKPAP